MSYAMVALQERAQLSADTFCRSLFSPRTARRREKTVRHSHPDASPPHPRLNIGSFYRPRDHEVSPFFKIVRDRFDDSKHRMCEEHAGGARRAATGMVAVNLSGYTRNGIRKGQDSPLFRPIMDFKSGKVPRD
jgi:hypothetical protein